MITSRIQIGNGAIEDFYEKWGFKFKESDNRLEAPIKKRDSTSYIEEAGEHIDPRTVPDAFDYKVKFIIDCPNRDLVNANAKIAAFNNALYERISGSDIRKYKVVTFFNDRDRVKIVGIPEPIAVPSEFYRRQDGRMMDAAVVELSIRVYDPTLCDFNT